MARDYKELGLARDGVSEVWYRELFLTCEVPYETTQDTEFQRSIGGYQEIPGKKPIAWIGLQVSTERVQDWGFLLDDQLIKC